jgi:hypothetical protein
MQITLEGKKFTAPSPKARAVRKAIEITEKVDFNNMKAADLDNLLGYIVDLFGKQFTLDDIYDGLDADKLIPTLMECLNGVVGTLGAKLEQFPNVQAGK